MKKTITFLAITAIATIITAIASADTITPRMGLTVPALKSASWGTKLNSDLNILDSSACVLGASSNVFINPPTVPALYFTDGSTQTTAAISPLAYVPYIGALNDVNIGTHSITTSGNGNMGQLSVSTVSSAGSAIYIGKPVGIETINTAPATYSIKSDKKIWVSNVLIGSPSNAGLAGASGQGYLDFGNLASNPTYIATGNDSGAKSSDSAMVFISSGTSASTKAFTFGVGTASSYAPVAAIDYSGNLGIGTTSVHTKLTVNGPIATAYSSKTSTYTVTSSDSFIKVDASTNTYWTLSLPTASGIAGRTYHIKKIDTVGVVVVDPNGSETIDGESTYILGATGKPAITIRSDGANWWIF